MRENCHAIKIQESTQMITLLGHMQWVMIIEQWYAKDNKFISGTIYEIYNYLWLLILKNLLKKQFRNFRNLSGEIHSSTIVADFFQNTVYSSKMGDTSQVLQTHGVLLASNIIPALFVSKRHYWLSLVFTM